MKKMTLSQLQQKISKVWSLTKKTATETEYWLFLIEEIGELAEAVRKKKRGKKAFKSKSLSKELGDILFMLVTLANHYNISLEDGIIEAIEDIEKRYCRKNGKVSF